MLLNVANQLMGDPGRFHIRRGRFRFPRGVRKFQPGRAALHAARFAAPAMLPAGGLFGLGMMAFGDPGLFGALSRLGRKVVAGGKRLLRHPATIAAIKGAPDFMGQLASLGPEALGVGGLPEGPSFAEITGHPAHAAMHAFHGGGRRRGRMNVANVHALRRSLRRLEGFSKLAHHVVQFTAHHKLKKHRKGGRRA